MVSMRHNRTAGRDYLKQKVLENARAARVSIEELAWSEPVTQDISELTIRSGTSTRTHVIHNLDLENVQRRPYLDRLATFIVRDVA
jgi:hypothetical protein